MKRIFLALIIVCFTTTSATETSEQQYKDLKYCIFSGNANKPLAEAIVKKLGAELGESHVKRFNDGEISIQIKENIRNQDVFIIQPTCSSKNASVNDNLMELFFMVRSMKRASAGSITAVIPYYGYGRQDRKTAPRVPISAADVAMMLEAAGVDRVVAVDLHCGQIQGFFQQIPVDNLYSFTLFVPYMARKNLENPIVISPDAGAVSRAKKFRNELEKYGVQAGLGIIIKQRAEAGIIDSMDLVGDVEGRDVILIDDLCDTAGTLVKAAEELKKFGARDIYACITHPVFSEPAFERIKNSYLKEIVVTDTIPLSESAPDTIVQLSIAPLLAEVIYRIQTNQSVSEVFEND